MLDVMCRIVAGVFLTALVLGTVQTLHWNLVPSAALVFGLALLAYLVNYTASRGIIHQQVNSAHSVASLSVCCELVFQQQR